MKVYVDELPKSCNNCKLGWFYDCQYCILRPDLMEQDKWCEKEKHCPLQSLTDHDKQVRKEVCEKFVEQFMIEYTMGNEPVEDIIYKVADQIQGE